MAVKFPEVFGRYVLQSKLATGGMAEVFRATLPGFGGFERFVAIKRLHRQYGRDSSFVRMMTDEAKIVSQLAHPNVVQILDVGQVGTDYYLAMELVDGPDLFRLLQTLHERNEQMPLEVACFIAAELACGLDYAHSRCDPEGSPLRIIHRDVSPQNVLLSYQGEVKLTDFGIARATNRTTETQSGIIKGKIYYMSPEQAAGEPLDHRTDLFSLGIILYEALTTCPLYDDPDESSLFTSVTRAKFKPIREFRGDLPPALEAIVNKALARSQGDRFASGLDLRDALTGFIRAAGLECDRVKLGRYLRRIFEMAEYAPPKPLPLKDHSSDEMRWSVIAPIPQEPPAAATRPAIANEARPAPLDPAALSGPAETAPRIKALSEAQVAAAKALSLAQAAQRHRPSAGPFPAVHPQPAPSHTPQAAHAPVERSTPSLGVPKVAAHAPAGGLEPTPDLAGLQNQATLSLAVADVVAKVGTPMPAAVPQRQATPLPPARRPSQPVTPAPPPNLGANAPTQRHEAMSVPMPEERTNLLISIPDEAEPEPTSVPQRPGAAATFYSAATPAPTASPSVLVKLEPSRQQSNVGPRPTRSEDRTIEYPAVVSTGFMAKRRLDLDLSPFPSPPAASGAPSPCASLPDSDLEPASAALLAVVAGVWLTAIAMFVWGALR